MKNILKTVGLALLLVFAPADAQINFGKLKEKVQKVTSKIDQVTVKASDITVKASDIGKKASNARNPNLGAVTNAGGGSQMFGDNSITFSKTRGGAAEKNFTVNDNIYATVKLKEPILNFLKEEGLENEPFYDMSITLVYVLSGVTQGEFATVRIPKVDYDKTTLVLDILPTKGDTKSQYFLAGKLKTWIANPLSNFDQGGGSAPAYGTQQYDLYFGPNDQYHGSFNYSVKNKAEQKIVAQRIDDAYADMADDIASVAKLPAAFSTPGKFTDPELSIANIKSMLTGDGYSLLKVVIDAGKGSDYSIQKNELDIPKYKITAKPVWVVYKAENGKCYFTKEFFLREYEGGGSYGPLKQAVTTASNTLIACDNVK